MKQHFSIQEKKAINFYILLFLLIQIFVFCVYTYAASFNTDLIADIPSSPFLTTHESMHDMESNHSVDPGDFSGPPLSEKDFYLGQPTTTIPMIRISMNEETAKGLHITVTALNKGDVNSDGKVSIVDALLIARYDVGLNMENVDNFNADAGDVNGDDSIDISDAQKIARYVVGLDVL